MSLQINTPVPKDIPLDLPLPEWLLVTLLIFSFLLHIIRPLQNFMNSKMPFFRIDFFNF